MSWHGESGGWHGGGGVFGGTGRAAETDVSCGVVAVPSMRDDRVDGAADVRALFQQRVAGDGALLRLANLRFRQAGMPAEVYADNPDHLEYVLGFVPEHRTLPVVHLSRSANLLDASGRSLVEAFASRFAGRVAGLVVHDKGDMVDRLPEVVAALRELGAAHPQRPGRPMVYLEFATGLPVDRFVEVAQRIADVGLASMCIDIGHVGIQQAKRSLTHSRPDLTWKGLSPQDPRLPEVVDQVQAATGTALPAVLRLIETIGAIGKPVHFHLHDGHPLVPGLSDHFSFLTRVPVPFLVAGRYALPSMFGPAGLADVVRTAVRACSPGSASFTLEIHQVEGRLPLADAADLFMHWHDVTNAERMNYWLTVLADNHLLAGAALDGWRHRTAELVGGRSPVDASDGGRNPCP